MSWPSWPGTPGGASSPSWGRSIQLYIQAGIGSGYPFTMGPATYDRLDSGNVMGPSIPGGTLWLDLHCDTITTSIIDGADRGAGIFSKDQAATLTLTLYDPARKYDPSNSASPYWYRGKSRLGAGNQIKVWAEVLNAAGTGVVSFTLFQGVTEQWLTDVAQAAVERRTKVTASGAVRWMAAQDYAELTTAVGAGDTTAQRLARLRTYFNWPGVLEQHGADSNVTLQASTMAQSFWELLGRTMDDELGYLHVQPDGTIRWWSRAVWATAPPAPSVTLGCAPGIPAFDVIVDSTTGGTDEQLRNAVYAARSGGVQQVSKSPASIAAHGGYETTMNRTDLGLADDLQVAAWAQQIVMMFAYPVAALTKVVAQPAVHGETTGALWRALLGLAIISDTLRVVWAPEVGSVSDQLLRVLGVTHTIMPGSWEVAYETLPAVLGGTASTFHMGPHALDRLDAGNVMAAAH